MKKKSKEKKKVKEPVKPVIKEEIPETDKSFDFGGLPDRNLKKNLGCG